MKPIPVALGLDLGTSSLKACLVTATGETVASVRRPISMCSPRPGTMEQNSTEWISVMHQAVTVLLSSVTMPVNVAAIGLSGQVPTAVILDPSGRPLGPAITWLDTRAEVLAASLLEDIGADQGYDLTGTVLDGRYVGPMVRWAMGARPLRPDGIGHVMNAKDFVLYTLTGQVTTDLSTAPATGAWDVRKQDWSPELLEIWSLRREWLPTVVGPETIVGPLRADVLPLPAGIPVCAGLADALAALYGLEAVGAEPPVLLEGTSSAIMGVMATPQLDPQRRYLVLPYAHGQYVWELDILTTGAAYAWFETLFGPGDVTGNPNEVRPIIRWAMEAPRGAEGVRFTPYLGGGEQGARWDPTLTGAATGIRLTTSRSHLARALIEGVFEEVGACLAAAGVVLGAHRALTLVSPWGAPGPYAQWLAEYLHRPVVPLTLSHASAYGAARLAWDALDGRHPALRPL